MPKHALEVPGYDGDLKKLAEAAYGMRYDRVAEYIGHSAAELERQQAGDYGRGNVQLAALLEEAARLEREQEVLFQRIWQLCRPHMERRGEL